MNVASWLYLVYIERGETILQTSLHLTYPGAKAMQHQWRSKYLALSHHGYRVSVYRTNDICGWVNPDEHLLSLHLGRFYLLLVHERYKLTQVKVCLGISVAQAATDRLRGIPGWLDDGNTANLYVIERLYE